MLLADITNVMAKSNTKLATQQEFLASVVAKKDAGEKTISVYVDGLWTVQDIDQFIEATKSTLAAYTAYDKGINGVHDTLQEQLNNFVEQAGEYQDSVQG